MLICSGAFIYFFTLQSLAAKERYPPVDCGEVKKYYGNDIDKWQRHAYDGYMKNLKLLD